MYYSILLHWSKLKTVDMKVNKKKVYLAHIAWEIARMLQQPCLE